MSSRAKAHSPGDEARALFRGEMTDETVLFLLTGVGVVQTDMTTERFMKANETFCDIVGYTEGELRGMTYLELTHPDDRKRDARSFAALQREESKRGTSLTRCVRKDGAEMWLELHITVFGKGGQAYSVALVNDVTERTQEEKARTEELRQSEARFRRVFDASPMPFSISRLADGTVLAINDSALAAFGFAREQVVGRGMAELGVQSSLLTGREAFARQLRAQRSLQDIEVSLTLPFGGTLHVLSAYEVVEVQGEELLLSMFLDISERKRTEEQLRHAIAEVMSDTGWFSHKVLERLAHIRTGSTELPAPVAFSKREQEVLERIAKGMSNEQIAAELGVAAQTVRNYATTIYSKLGVRTRPEAIVWARERGIV